jgi:hypothetical protein
VRRWSLLLAGLFSLACAHRADQVFVAPGRLVTGSSGAQPGYAIKVVRAKQAPTELVGDDGSICRLTAERFAQVEVGDWLACDWTVAPDSSAHGFRGRASGALDVQPCRGPERRRSGAQGMRAARTICAATASPRSSRYHSEASDLLH